MPYRVSKQLSCLAVLLLVQTASAAQSYRQRLQDWLVEQGHGAEWTLIEVNVYGDGDPSNGIEDSRIGQLSPAWNRQEHRPWNNSSGTVNCDGKVRGSATVVDVSDTMLAPPGIVLATAAHVLVDLDSGRPFRRCTFDYMGLGELPGYRFRIDAKRMVQGGFEAAAERERPEFGERDWAFLHIDGTLPPVSSSAGIRLRAFASLDTTRQEQDGKFAFIGYSSKHRGVAISTRCTVRLSNPEDLGGGSWKGQLLDDCDSGKGASGGALVALHDGTASLVGIRSGAHWDSQAYPVTSYPEGPPMGDRWDVRTNTNYSRAIDTGMLAKLRNFLQKIYGEHDDASVY